MTTPVYNYAKSSLSAVGGGRGEGGGEEDGGCDHLHFTKQLSVSSEAVRQVDTSTEVGTENEASGSRYGGKEVNTYNPLAPRNLSARSPLAKNPLVRNPLEHPNINHSGEIFDSASWGTGGTGGTGGSPFIGAVRGSSNGNVIYDSRADGSSSERALSSPGRLQLAGEVAQQEEEGSASGWFSFKVGWFSSWFSFRPDENNIDRILGDGDIVPIRQYSNDKKEYIVT